MENVKLSKLSKIVSIDYNCQKLSKFSKIVEIAKNNLKNVKLSKKIVKKLSKL